MFFIQKILVSCQKKIKKPQITQITQIQEQIILKSVSSVPPRAVSKTGKAGPWLKISFRRDYRMGI
jgi:hypothetical protein